MGQDARVPVAEALGTYMAGALARPVPDAVTEKAKHVVLDTLAAMVSGSRLKPGELAIRYARAQGGTPEAGVAGSDVVTSAVNAALANGMLAHADETDDVHGPSATHPGCAVVPAALAMGEREGRDGAALLRAVALGYDVGTRAMLALGPAQVNRAGRSTYAMGGLFGAAAAAGALAGLDPRQMRWLLAYAAQQASGLACWARDGEHVEKAFDFGGGGARNGVAAATMVQAGFSGVDDVLSGEGNFLDAFAAEPEPDRLTQGLGEDYEILRTTLKKWCVGAPIQAPVDALTGLMAAHALGPDDLATLTVRLPEGRARFLANPRMLDIDCRHLLALTLLDGTLTFAAAHDGARTRDPAVAAVRQRVRLVGDPALNTPDGPTVLEFATPDGRAFAHRVAAAAVRGQPDNPMPRDEVGAKALDLLTPPLGAERARQLLDRIWTLEQVADVRELRPLLRA